MKREDFEQLVASLLYGEISEDERRLLEEWLRTHPDDQSEYDELKKTYAWLNRLAEIPASPVPLRAADLVPIQPKKNRGLKWALAAAACFAFAFLCSYQGFVVQVGQVRIAFGPAVQDTGVRNEISRQISASLLPTLRELTDSVQKIRQNSVLAAQRQDTLGNSIQVLTALRAADQENSDRKFDRFTVELGRFIDDRLNRIYGVSSRPLVYTGNNPGFSGNQDNK